ncbi:MAG TPA: TlpA disulfide reductase family protein, partial [Ramlibacter sp.]|nr:TlpA disulfide reductase family protein [Ramlibacter sp.]
VLSAAALAVGGTSLAQGTAQTPTAPLRRGAARRARPMTANEEAAAARAVAASIADQTGEPVHPAVGRMPQISRRFNTFDGAEYSEARARGKLLMVYYWASWCPVCKLVSPRLHEFWLRHRGAGVEVLALSVDSAITPAVAAIERAGYRFPAAMATTAGLDDYMMARSLPTLMVRSRRGVIVSVDEGDIEADEFQDYLVHL